MPSMTIKRIPQNIYRSLKRNAQANHRSLNGETIACLERSLGLARPTPEAVLSRVDAIRESLMGIRLTDRVLHEAKTNGRP